MKYAKRYVEDVEFYAEDAGRTDNEYLARVIDAVTKAGAYVRFTLTRPGGCVQKDSVLVTVDSQVELELSSDTTICKGESLALEVKASGNGLGYRWELDGELLGSSPRLSGLVPMESTVYGVTVTSRACEPVSV